MDVDQSSQDSSIMEMTNSESILHKIANLYAEKLMSDICLIVGNNRYPAHRVILCASSEVFQVMLMNPEWNECRKNVIELKEEPCCSMVFPQFLKYLYIGQIRVSIHSVMPMLALADKYNVNDLVVLCVDYMQKHIAKAATQGFFVSWFQYTTAFSPCHPELSNALKRFLKWNLNIISESKDFSELDVQVMTLLLQQSDVVVSNEYELFEIIVKWLFLQKEKLESDSNLCDEEKLHSFRQLIQSTITYIRFPMMSPAELAQIVLNPIVNYYKEFFVDQIAIGMSYHSGHRDRIFEVRRTEQGCMQFTPRFYTSDIWSFNIFIKEFHAIEDYANFVYYFYSQRSLAEGRDDDLVTWEIEFFPRGVKYYRAKMVWGEDIPECVLRTVRLRVTCKDNLFREERFKITVLVTALQNKIPHISSIHERTEYFSEHFRVLNIDGIIPYGQSKISPYLVGADRNNICLQIIVSPMGPYTCHESPAFELK